jgi:hypothetical protein
VRGDSLRDFYAKTLAVAGLGLLAGAGAIVDYWPVGGPLPAVTRVAGLDDRTPVMLPAAPDRIPAPVFRRTVSHVTALPVASETWAVTASEEVSLPPAPLPVDLTNGLQYGTSVELPDLDLLDLPEYDLISLADLGQNLSLASGDATDDSHRLLSDALQRTRASLRGARWFLGNKIQGVMGAVKKVSPFWDASGPTYAPR